MTYFLVFIALCVILTLLYRKTNQHFNEAEQKYVVKYKDALNGSDEIIKIDSSEIQSAYKLSLEKATALSINARKVCVNDAIQSLSDHNTLSPENNAEVLKIATRLQLNPQYIPDVISRMEKMVKYWKIEHEELPTLSVDVNLQKGEVCYYSCRSNWHENRTVTKSISYSGFSTSIKITKGVRYRVGTVTPHRITEDKLTLIDSGQLYVTNKRLIFVGRKKNANIKYNNILSIVPYSDAIGVQKDSGKSPILSSNEADILGRILVKAISPFDNNSGEMAFDPFEEELKKLVASNRKLDAVALLKKEKGYSLIDAKNYVDSL